MTNKSYIVVMIGEVTMPKFSDNEKEIIKQKLFSEGERLFTTFGIKKVSIDELVQATGIAKGSFYSFYPSKEHLYMDIVGNQQKQMWREMDEFLDKHRALSPRELVKKCFVWMFSQLQRYPLLEKADGETAAYLYRKLPHEIIEAHTKDDSYELIKLQEYGVHFKCNMEIATKTLQMIAMIFLNLGQNEDADRNFVFDIILDGVLKEIVADHPVTQGNQPCNGGDEK